MDRGINISIGPGELIDRLSILQLKAARATSEDLRNAVLDQIQILQRHRGALDAPSGIAKLETALTKINADLWDVESKMRAPGLADEGFLVLARQVPDLNDERARLKGAIDALCGHPTTETKCYDAG